MPTIFEMWRDKQSMFLFRQRELKCQSWFTSALASLSVSLSDTHAYTNIQTRFISWRVEALWGISECSGCSLADGVGCGVLNIKPEGHCATRWPCGLRLCRITLGTTSSPTPAGVIRCWSNHTHKHYLSCCHITNTRGCHLLGACLSLLWPQTEVIDLEDCDSCRLGVADWLLGPHSNAIYCWATFSNASCDFIAMPTGCEVDRHLTAKSGEWRTWCPGIGKLEGTGSKWWPIEKSEGIC